MPLAVNQLPMIVIGFTADITIGFLSAQCVELSKRCRMAVLSSPGPNLAKLGVENKIETLAVQMDREISPIHDLRALLQLFLLFRRVQPSVIDFSTPKAGLLGMLAGWLAGVPCRVYTLRGLRLETAKGWKRTVLMGTEWIACKCAHRVICVSASLRQRAIDLRLVEATKALVVGSGSSGVLVEKYLPTSENVERSRKLYSGLDLPENVPVIGFVGRFTRDKGIPELIDAFDELRLEHPALRLLLVGDFEDGDPVPESVQARIESDPFIVRTGFVSDTSPYYHLMDLLVLPTYREGFPNVPLQAQVAAKPVVTTRVAGAVDSVQDGKTGLMVPVGDASALAHAISSLLCDATKRKEMGRSGQEWVLREFTLSRVIDAQVRVYQSLISEKLGTGVRQSQWPVSPGQ
jgi:glycosyltransferase involved in cell wall biosynthesis